MRRYVVAVLVAMVLVVSGCSGTPAPAPSTVAPASPQSPPTPALTTQTAQPVLDHLRSVMIRADKRQSRTLARTVLTGGAFERARVYYELRKSAGITETWGAPKVRAQSVVASPSGTFPETALVIARFSADEPERRKTRVVYDLVRSTERDRWLLRSRVFIAAKKIEPAVATISPVSTPIEQSQRMNGVTLNRVSQTLATALNRPGRKSAQKFTRDPYRAVYRRGVNTWREKHVRIKTTFSPAGPSIAWPTRSGGALTIVPGYLSISKVMLDGWSFSYRKGSSMGKKLPHHYASGRWDYASSSVVAAPAEGRLRLLTADSSLTHLSLTRDYAW